MTDVARLAGVSYQTVSRVLNDHPSVRPATRARVRQAMTSLGYRPNAAAQALAGRRTRQIGVVAQASSLFGPSSMLQAVELAAREANYSVTVTVPERHLGDAVERLVRQGAEGLVVMAPIVGDVETITLDLPMVVAQAGVEHEHSVVAVDQFSAAAEVTRHLLDQGPSTVWHIAGPDDWYEARARVDGWRSALEAAGVDQPDVLHGDWTAESGYELGVHLASAGGVQAVFVANDQMALGVLHALREAGIDVPGDVLVAGFDDVPEARFFAPPLTTVRQDFAEVGRQAIRLLTEELDRGGPAHTSVSVPAELVIRTSSLARARS